ncbi:hypothetical protein JQ615_19815 [Bradyrhizobium jicamae]|uniref:Uncharacterized protein n=1 Tax=Bradyrhizobium jicamae TaxID=280332 RepID=A0ABS5FLL0_9BRAD|nr:hypothetical protein [Bradyrhizobium jicamae]MBR0797636.1 hypothetical protein [Bradyrhizobium jicamae]
MSIVPLDIERKFEQRWAARRVQRVRAARERQRPESQRKQPAVSVKAEEAAQKRQPAA